MLVPSKSQTLIPPKATASKLFIAGSILGPIVDSLHNQCLLTYDYAPVTLDLPGSTSPAHLFASSWAVPPLLGFAYVVLGYILPQIIKLLIGNFGAQTNSSKDNMTTPESNENLRSRAILAVSSTAAIIKLSEFLETHLGTTYQINNIPISLDAKTNLLIMTLADAIQWISLDRTLTALLAAIITGVGGPLSELPFVASGFWHYNVDASDYLPLSGALFHSGSLADGIATILFGDEYSELALSGITGPCYFAVTLDAIALGRFFCRNSKLLE